MDALTEFLYMGGYAFYVWWSYAIVCALLVSSGELKRGWNDLRVRVHTTLIRSFEGQWFDTDGHCYREVGSG